MKNSAWYHKLWHNKLNTLPLKTNAESAWSGMKTALDQHLPVGGSVPAATKSIATKSAAKSIVAKVISFITYAVPAAAMIFTAVHYLKVPEKSKNVQLQDGKRGFQERKGIFTQELLSNDSSVVSKDSSVFSEDSVPNGSSVISKDDSVFSKNSSVVLFDILKGNAGTYHTGTDTDSLKNGKNRESAVFTYTYENALPDEKDIDKNKHTGVSTSANSPGKSTNTNKVRSLYKSATSKSKGNKGRGSSYPVFNNVATRAASFSQMRMYLGLYPGRSAVLTVIPFNSIEGQLKVSASNTDQHLLVIKDQSIQAVKAKTDLNKQMASKKMLVVEKIAVKEAAQQKAKQQKAEQRKLKSDQQQSKKDKNNKEKAKKEIITPPYNYGLNAGVNVSGNSKTIYLGVFGNYALSRRWLVGGGLALNSGRLVSGEYTHESYYQPDSLPPFKIVDSRRLMVLEIPVHIEYKISENISIKAGPVIGLTIKQSSISSKVAPMADLRDTVYHSKQIDTALRKTTVNKLNIGFKTGVSFHFGKFDADASYQIQTPYKVKSDLGAYQKSSHFFQIGVGYRFK